MWSRKELKNRAKEVLKKNYWTAFWVSIVIAISHLGSGGNGGSGSKSSDGSELVTKVRHFRLDMETLEFLEKNWNWIVLAVMGIIIASILLRVLIGCPLEVGGQRFFIRSAENLDSKKSIRFAFQKDNWMPIAFTMFVKGFQNFLWFWLLIIPGIVKFYAYRMVPYILAENPNVGSQRAIELSCEMTRGHKWQMFVLDLSFLGWYILGVLAFGIGVFFVMPYQNATFAELYLVFKKNALENGMTWM